MKNKMLGKIRALDICLGLFVLFVIALIITWFCSSKKKEEIANAALTAQGENKTYDTASKQGIAEENIPTSSEDYLMIYTVDKISEDDVAALVKEITGGTIVSHMDEINQYIISIPQKGDYAFYSSLCDEFKTSPIVDEAYVLSDDKPSQSEPEYNNEDTLEYDDFDEILDIDIDDVLAPIFSGDGDIIDKVFSQDNDFDSSLDPLFIE